MGTGTTLANMIDAEKTSALKNALSSYPNLLNNKMDDGINKTPLAYATYMRKYNSMAAILESQPDLSSEGNTEALALCESDRGFVTDSLKILLKHGMNPNCTNGARCFMKAVLWKNAEAVKLLFAAGFDLETDYHGKRIIDAASISLNRNNDEIQKIVGNVIQGIRPTREEVGLPPLTTVQDTQPISEIYNDRLEIGGI